MRNDKLYYAELKRLIDVGYEYFWSKRNRPAPQPDSFLSFKSLYDCPVCGKVHEGKHINCPCGYKGVSAFKTER